jgi:hypothetical protein
VAGDPGLTGGQNMRKRHRKILIAAALTALASMAILASVAQASKPAPGYADFAGCPNRAEQPFIGVCVKDEFTGGHIGIGNREIPITNTILLRGGVEQETENFLYNSEGGIIPVRQTVPGGVTGFTGYKWLDQAIKNSSQLKLYATVELAGQVGSQLSSTFDVPVKIHLENQFLGNACYIGSNASPIVLHLSVTKEQGEFEEEAARPEVIRASGGIFADHTYSVPGASGCQFNYGSTHQSIDSVVNKAYALPAAAGKDSTELNYVESRVSNRVVNP